MIQATGLACKLLDNSMILGIRPKALETGLGDDLYNTGNSSFERYWVLNAGNEGGEVVPVVTGLRYERIKVEVCTTLWNPYFVLGVNMCGVL